MKIDIGDIWEYNRFKVVPTNLGWRNDGHNVMGRGVAKQAAKKYPGLTKWYGKRCQEMAKLNSNGPCLQFYQDLILFPVKPLMLTVPHLSWQQKADLGLVRNSIIQLAEWHRLPGPSHNRVVLPLVGCGNGGLSPYDVLPIMFEYLANDDFTLVLTSNSWEELISWLMKMK